MENSNLNPNSDNNNKNYTTTKTNTETNSFNVLYQKMLHGTHDTTLNQIINNRETLSYEMILQEKYSNKINDCKEILNNLREITLEEKIDTTENGKITINSIPVRGREKEFKRGVNFFNKCYDRFQKIDSNHQRKIWLISKFTNDSLNKCVYDNCKKIYTENNSSDNQILNKTKNCISDCFNYDIKNRKVSIGFVNDEYLKYIDSIDKLAKF